MHRWSGVLVAGLVACGGDDGGDEAADTSGTQGDDDDDASGTSAESGSTDMTSPDGSSTDPTDGGSSSESGGGGCVDDCNPGGVVMWQAQWGTDDGWDTTLAASVGADGRIAIAGGIFPPDAWPPTDGFVAAWDSEGTALFDEMLGERVYGAAAIGDDVVLAGETDAQALWLTRRDTAGASVWDSVDESGTMVFAGPLVLLPGDELFTAGGTPAAGFVAHYDDAGMQLSLAETMVNVFVVAAVAIDTDVVVVADDLAGGYWLARMDPDGTTDWERMNAGTPTAMTITEDGELVIAAIVATEMSTYTELHRWGNDGTMVSAYPIPLGDAIVLDMLAMPSGDVVMAGYTQAAGLHCWIGRTDDTNATVWQVSFNEENAESECHTIDFAPDDTFYAGGSRKSEDDLDAWVMRFDPG